MARREALLAGNKRKIPGSSFAHGKRHRDDFGGSKEPNNRAKRNIGKPPVQKEFKLSQ